MTASGSECSGAPQGLVSELILINVCVKNKWAEWTLSCFTGYTRVVSMLESTPITQRRLYTLEKWAGRTLMRFNSPVLHFSPQERLLQTGASPKVGPIKWFGERSR